jgi:serine/threonine protein kinase/WD40 repeat protein
MTDESVFAAALAIPRPADRAAYLENACAGKPALRREVEALLSAHAADNPLDRPLADLAATGDHDATDAGPPAAEVGDRIGPYRLMEQIGEGGFGLVFVAEQTEPVRRKVALKVLKPGMDTRDVVARFEAERQALALMDHPNIAKVLDAGRTPAGRPYFVMELVRGVQITDYCDSQRLPPKERLALLVQVCQAVQHAHQKGVIHRDIKPSNVLVTMIDGKPVPKVIDFGVAKAVGQSLTDKTVYTRFAQILGTPLYMSPEQAEMSGVDVDTRTDVYALGVLLYELLTGTTPFDRDRFRRAAFDEIRRIIREEDPPRPSTRLSSLGQTLTDVSAQRGTDPGRLAGLIRGELDWIVMKCLEKDRNRRYETASGLARDLQRFLEGGTVEACPPTFGYRLRKLYRRNRAAVWVAALVLGLTYVGASGIYFAYRRAVHAEARLAEQRDEALASEERAIAATREAAQERDKVAESNASLRALADRQRRTLYASEMNLAQAAWESGDARRTLELLLHWAPKPGEEDLRGFEWHYWNRQAHQEKRAVRLQGLTPEDREMGLEGAISPDGTRVAAAVRSRNPRAWSLRVWDTSSGREIWRGAPVSGSFEWCAFSENGRRILTNQWIFGPKETKAESHVWDSADGKLLYNPGPCHVFSASFASLSADGEQLTIDEREGDGNLQRITAVRIIRVSDGREIARMPVESENVTRHLVIGRDDGRVLLDRTQEGGKHQLTLFERAGGRQIFSVDLARDQVAYDACLSPGADEFAVRFTSHRTDEHVDIFDAHDGRRLSRHQLPGRRLGYSPGASSMSRVASRLAVVQTTHAIVYDLERTGDSVTSPSASFEHEFEIAAVLLATSGSRLVTLDKVGVVREWNLNPPPSLKTPFWGADGSGFSINADGSRRFFFSNGGPGGEDLEPRIVDRAGRQVGNRLAPMPRGMWFTPEAASADGQTRAIVIRQEKGEGLAIFWDLARGRERCRIPLGPGLWEEIAVAPDGSRAALIGSPAELENRRHLSHFVRILDVNTGAVVWTSEKQHDSGFFQGICFDPSGRHLVVSRGSETGDDWAIVWYDAQTMNEAARLPVGSRAIVGAYSPDGRLVAVRDQRQSFLDTGSIRVGVFSVESVLRGEQPASLYQLTGSMRQFVHIIFSPDGSRLLADGQGAIRLWDSATGAELLSFRSKETGPVFQSPFPFSADGHHIWAGLDENGHLWGWDATPLPDEVLEP